MGVIGRSCLVLLLVGAVAQSESVRLRAEADAHAGDDAIALRCRARSAVETSLCSGATGRVVCSITTISMIRR